MRTILNKIIVRPIERPETTDSGIYIPAPARKAIGLGEVVAVGNGFPFADHGTVVRAAPPVNVGETIEYIHTEIYLEIEGVKYEVIGEADILVITKEVQ